MRTEEQRERDRLIVQGLESEKFTEMQDNLEGCKEYRSRLLDENDELKDRVEELVGILDNRNHEIHLLKIQLEASEVSLKQKEGRLEAVKRWNDLRSRKIEQLRERCNKLERENELLTHIKKVCEAHHLVNEGR